jgi:hypothetical protein
MTTEEPMPIAQAPRFEVVLRPLGRLQPEGEEIPEGTLFDAYLIVYHMDGIANNLKLAGGPFTHEEGGDLITNAWLMVAKKFAPPEALGASH